MRKNIVGEINNKKRNFLLILRGKSGEKNILMLTALDIIMKMGWWPCSCCLGCFYRCFQGRKKSNSIEPGPPRSPTPSIALSGVSGSSRLDEISIQEQLSVFYYGQTKTASGRRYSHPNQIKWVEEYENQRRASSVSASPLPSMFLTVAGSANGLHSDHEDDHNAPSPVMMYPVIPPGIKITNTDCDKAG